MAEKTLARGPVQSLPCPRGEKEGRHWPAVVDGRIGASEREAEASYGGQVELKFGAGTANRAVSILPIKLRLRIEPGTLGIGLNAVKTGTSTVRVPERQEKLHCPEKHAHAISEPAAGGRLGRKKAKFKTSGNQKRKEGPYEGRHNPAKKSYTGKLSKELKKLKGLTSRQRKKSNR